MQVGGLNIPYYFLHVGKRMKKDLMECKRCFRVLQPKNYSGKWKEKKLKQKYCFSKTFYCDFCKKQWVRDSDIVTPLELKRILTENKQKNHTIFSLIETVS